MPTVVEFLTIVDFCTMILIKPIFIIPDYCTVQDYLYLDITNLDKSLTKPCKKCFWDRALLDEVNKINKQTMSEPLDDAKYILSLSYCGVKHRHPKVDKDGLER